MKALVKKDGQQVIRELAEKIDCSLLTVVDYFECPEFTQTLGTWVPHESPPRNYGTSKFYLLLYIIVIILYYIFYFKIERHRCHNDSFLQRIVWRSGVLLAVVSKWVAPIEKPRQTSLVRWRSGWSWSALRGPDSLRIIFYEPELTDTLFSLVISNQLCYLKKGTRETSSLQATTPHLNVVGAVPLYFECKISLHPPHSSGPAFTGSPHLFRALRSHPHGFIFDVNKRPKMWRSLRRHSIQN